MTRSRRGTFTAAPITLAQRLVQERIARLRRTPWRTPQRMLRPRPRPSAAAARPSASTSPPTSLRSDRFAIGAGELQPNTASLTVQGVRRSICARIMPSRKSRSLARKVEQMRHDVDGLHLHLDAAAAKRRCPFVDSGGCGLPPSRRNETSGNVAPFSAANRAGREPAVVSLRRAESPLRAHEATRRRHRRRGTRPRSTRRTALWTRRSSPSQSPARGRAAARLHIVLP